MALKNVTEETALSQLREAYRRLGLEVRFYPECCTIMRWQLGRNGDGEHFTLIAYGPTPERLFKPTALQSSLPNKLNKTDMSYPPPLKTILEVA